MGERDFVDDIMLHFVNTMLCQAIIGFIICMTANGSVRMGALLQDTRWRF